MRSCTSDRTGARLDSVAGRVTIFHLAAVVWWLSLFTGVTSYTPQIRSAPATFSTQKTNNVNYAPYARVFPKAGRFVLSGEPTYTELSRAINTDVHLCMSTLYMGGDMPPACTHSTTVHAGKFVAADLLFEVEYRGACYTIRLVDSVAHVATIHGMQCEPRDRFWDCAPVQETMMHEISFKPDETARLYLRVMPSFTAALILGAALVGLTLFLGTSTAISSAPQNDLCLPTEFATILRDFSAVLNTSLMYSLCVLGEAVFPAGSLETTNGLAKDAAFAVAAISSAVCVMLLTSQSNAMIAPHKATDPKNIVLEAPFATVLRLMYEVPCLLTIALLRPPQVAEAFGLLLNLSVGITLSVVSARDATFIFNACNETNLGLSILVIVYLSLVQFLAGHLIYPCCMATDTIHPGFEIIITGSFMMQSAVLGARYALTTWCR